MSLQFSKGGLPFSDLTTPDEVDNEQGLPPRAALSAVREVHV